MEKENNNQKVEQTITVQEFINRFYSFSPADRKKYVQSLIKTSYIGYVQKQIIARTIVEANGYERDGEGNRTTRVHFYTSGMLVNYAYALINNYTLIQMDADNVVDDFDLLDSKGLVEYIIGLLPKHEIERFNELIKQERDDFEKNHYETRAYLSAQVDKLGIYAKEIAKDILPDLIKVVAEYSPESVKTIVDFVAKWISGSSSRNQVNDKASEEKVSENNDD